MNILNKPTSSLNQCLTWSKNKNATELFNSLIPILYKTAEQEGVDPTLVVAQCAKETGYCKFGGVLDASFKNPCGLKVSSGGACDDPNAHKRFNSWEEGILAQVQHLALYAGKKGYPVVNPLDPRHFSYLHGKCTTVESLSGNWAGSTYGQDLVKMMNEVINTKAEEDSKDNEIAKLKEVINKKDNQITQLNNENFILKDKLIKIHELSK